MAVDFDKRLADLAAQILVKTVRTYGEADVAAWLPGYSPATAAWSSVMFSGLDTTTSFKDATGSFETLTGSLPTLTNSFSALTGSFPVLTYESGSKDQETLSGLLGLPPRLPGVRLPTDEELVRAARSAPIMVHLEALGRWLGDKERLVTTDDLLHPADASELVQELHIEPDYLPYLWSYALVSDWVMFADDTDGRQTWAVLGATAYRWMDSDFGGTLHAWATVYATVLAVTLEVVGYQMSAAKRWQKFQGQGVTFAVMMFLARQTGLTLEIASNVVQIGAIGETPTGRTKKAWSAWVQQVGDPAVRLVAELAALHAIDVPASGMRVLTLTPLAQWALREQFTHDGIHVPVVRTSTPLSAANLVELTGGMLDVDFDAEFRHWLARRGPNRAAQELLLYAGSASPKARLIAVKLVRRIGPAALHAWLEAMQRQELRGYARIALSMMAADVPDSSLPLVLEPDPDDLDGVASDLVLLMGKDAIPDSSRIETLFAEIAPKGEEEWIIGLLAGGRHQDVVRLLELLSHYYSDRRVAKSARRAARIVARKRVAIGHGSVSARTISL